MFISVFGGVVRSPPLKEYQPRYRPMPRNQHCLMCCEVCNFASSRVLASVLRSASTFISQIVSPCLKVFGYATASLGVFISDSASTYHSVSSTVVISTLAIVSAQVLTSLIAFTSTSVLLIATIFTLQKRWQCA